MTTLIAMLMSLLLTACSAATMADVKSAAPPADLPPAEAAVEEKISYTVELQTWEDTVYAKDGTRLVSSSFQIPVLTACREDGTAITEPETEKETQALEAAAVFNERFSVWTSSEELDRLSEGAAEDLAWRQEAGYEWLGYALELSCNVYQTGQLVSVSGLYYSDTGGAHPNTYLMGWNFDLESGAFFEPELLSEGSALQETVGAELARQAQARAAESGLAPEDFFWSDYENILADWGSYAVSFDESGMRVAFSPYELAAYAAGAQEFHLSYDWLRPYLSQHGRELLGLETEE